LTDLTQQVQDRLDELERPPAVAPPVVEPQRLALPEQLMRYTQMNYDMDVIINRFVDCSTQILNDGILLIAENFPGQQNQIKFNVKKQIFLDNSSYQIKKIVDNYKSISEYRGLLRESIGVLNTINNRLQNPEFADFLQTREGGVFNFNYSGGPITAQQISTRLNAILRQCFIGTGFQELATREETDRRNIFNPNHNPVFRNDIFSNFVEPITLWLLVAFPHEVDIHNWFDVGRHLRPQLNLFPQVQRGQSEVPSLQYFQRYFQCYLDALTALSQINCDEVLRGGKQIKRLNTRKTKRRKIKRKSKTVKRI